MGTRSRSGWKEPATPPASRRPPPRRATARGTIADGAASGTVTLTGEQSLTFEAPRAELAAGLFERVAVEDGEPIQVRTIVLADGTAKGKKKKFDCARAQRTLKEAMRLAELEGNEEFRDDYYEVAYDWVRAGEQCRLRVGAAVNLSPVD